MIDERHLDELFSKYNQAFPECDASAEFMPRLWARIDARRSFSFAFQRRARLLVTASAALCLLFAGLNMLPHSADSLTHTRYANYADALSADTTLEKTYYSEAAPPPASLPPEYEYE
jgi:hypothetical protein